MADRECVTVTVVRTSDAFKREINVSMTDTLDVLKDKISRSDLGPIDREHQRIFHLGRELKSGRRSLGAIGFGKYGIYLVHLHSTQPKTLELSSDDDDGDDSDVVVEEVVIPRCSSRQGGGGGDVARVKRRIPFSSAAVSTTSETAEGGVEQVIELLGDDGDEEDIAVVDSDSHSAVGAKRRRER